MEPLFGLVISIAKVTFQNVENLSISKQKVDQPQQVKSQHVYLTNTLKLRYIDSFLILAFSVGLNHLHFALIAKHLLTDLLQKNCFSRPLSQVVVHLLSNLLKWPDIFWGSLLSMHCATLCKVFIFYIISVIVRVWFWKVSCNFVCFQ